MKKITMVALIIAALCVAPVCAADRAPQARQKKLYTVLTYVAGINDLNSFINADLNEMRAGAYQGAYQLAFVNTYKDNKSAMAQRIVVTPQGFYQDGPTLYNLDSGTPDTVIQAVLWAIDNYPSEYFVLNFWDHGSGPLNRSLIAHKRGICYDFLTGHYLNDYDMMKVLSTAQKRLGHNVNLVTCDACLMAGVELAFSLRPYVDHYVSSQEVIPGAGYQYQYVLDPLKNNPNPVEFAKKIVAAFDQCYRGTTWDYTLSAVQLNKIDPVVNSVNTVAILLLQALQSSARASVLTAIKRAAYSNPNIRFEERDYVDLYNLYRNLINELQLLRLDAALANNLNRALRDGMAYIQQAVFERVSSTRFNPVQGLSIYFPASEIHSSYTQLYWTRSVPNWLALLRAVVGR